MKSYTCRFYFGCRVWVIWSSLILELGICTKHICTNVWYGHYLLMSTMCKTSIQKSTLCRIKHVQKNSESLPHIRRLGIIYRGTSVPGHSPHSQIWVAPKLQLQIWLTSFQTWKVKFFENEQRKKSIHVSKLSLLKLAYLKVPKTEVGRNHQYLIFEILI